MREFSIKTVQSICEAATLPLSIPFIDYRLKEYQERYGGGHPYYAALYMLAHALDPKVVVELGAWQGTSAACLSAGAADGVVYTIDHHSDPGDEFNIQRTLEACDNYSNLGYIQGASCAKVAAVKNVRDAFPILTKQLGERKIDILFIDSWHIYEYAKADWDTYSPLLAPTSLIICDDILDDDSATIAGMRKFWSELPGEKYLDGRIHPGYPMGFIRLEAAS